MVSSRSSLSLVAISSLAVFGNAQGGFTTVQGQNSSADVQSSALQRFTPHIPQTTSSQLQQRHITTQPHFTASQRPRYVINHNYDSGYQYYSPYSRHSRHSGLDDMLPLMMMSGGLGAGDSMLPLMMMSDNYGSEDMLPLMVISGGLGGTGAGLAGDSMLPLMMMSGNFGGHSSYYSRPSHYGSYSYHGRPIHAQGHHSGSYYSPYSSSHSSHSGMSDVLPLLLLSGGLGGTAVTGTAATGTTGGVIDNTLLPFFLMGW